MVYLKKTKNQTGLYAGLPFKRGDIVLRLGENKDSTLSEKRTRTSIQIDDLHLEDPVGKFINHADLSVCNTLILGNYVIAIRDIAEDEEITFDYTTNEDSISSPFIDKNTSRWVGKRK